MMPTIDWMTVALGLLAGSAAGALFFAGLALAMRAALCTARPAPLLIFSAIVRIALLFAGGWWVAQLGYPALAGFAFAFMTVRFAILATLRMPAGEGRMRWN